MRRLEELRANKCKEMIVVNLNHSDLRFTFDYQFKIKEILSANEFVKLCIEGLPVRPNHTLLDLLGVKQQQLVKYSSFNPNRDSTTLNLWFTSKREAEEAFARIGELLLNVDGKCSPDKEMSKNQPKESVFVKIKWQTLKSTG